MANHPNPFRRYLFRRDFLRKIREKTRYELRTITRDGYRDQARIFGSQEPLIVFDAGANTGETARKYLHLFPKCNIHAFEPFPSTFSKLQSNIGHDPRVQAHMVALADRQSQARLYVSDSSLMNSLIPPIVERAWGFKKEPEYVEVQTTALDAFAEEHRISEIDVLKLDVQGGEEAVFKGASRLLLESRIGLIYTEVQVVPLYQNQSLFHELTSHLSQYGYTLFNLYNVRESGLGQLRWGDAIFLGPKLRHKLSSVYGSYHCGW